MIENPTGHGAVPDDDPVPPPRYGNAEDLCPADCFPTGPAEITLWGLGCEASTRTQLGAQPHGDVMRTAVEINGPDINYSGTCSIPVERFASLVFQAERLRRQPPSGDIADSTDIGNLTIKAEFCGGAIDYREAEDKAKLRILGKLILHLLRAAGIPTIPDMHPLGEP